MQKCCESVVKKLLSAGFASLALSMQAQVAEPLLTKTARVFAPSDTGLEFDYATAIGGRTNAQVIPEITLEAGLFSRLEALVRFPLLRVVSRQESVIGGGQLAIGARYRLPAPGTNSLAISLQAMVEAPTGDSRLVGNATQIMPGVMADWRPGRGIAVYSNFIFDRLLGGSVPRFTLAEFQDAVTVRTSRRIVAVFEIAGSTNLLTGRTQIAALPEVVFRAGRHFEWKAGFQKGLNAVTEAYGLRAQVAWFRGRRE